MARIYRVEAKRHSLGPIELPGHTVPGWEFHVDEGNRFDLGFTFWTRDPRMSIALYKPRGSGWVKLLDVDNSSKQIDIRNWNPDNDTWFAVLHSPNNLVPASMVLPSHSNELTLRWRSPDRTLKARLYVHWVGGAFLLEPSDEPRVLESDAVHGVDAELPPI